MRVLKINIMKIIPLLFLVALVLMNTVLLSAQSSAENNNHEKVFKFGIKTGVNMTSFNEGGDGFGFSLDLALRSEYQITQILGLKLDLGYTDISLPSEKGRVDADFFRMALLVDHRIPYKKVNFYGMVGPFMDRLISASYTEKSSQVEYKFDEYYKDYTFGISFGAGVEMNYYNIDWFAELMISPLIMRSINKNPMGIQESADYGVQLCFGMKYQFYPWNKKITRRKTPSMSLKKIKRVEE